MRSIGQLPDEKQARVFGDYLVVNGIANDLEPDDQGRWTVWVHEDDHLAWAQTLLDEFRQNANDPKYHRAAPEARELRTKEKQEQSAWAKRFRDRRQVWRGLSWRMGWLTAALAAVTLAVALLKALRGEDDPLVRALFITDMQSDGDLFHYTRGLPEIRSGEIWRVFTPIFLHFGPLHLIFNLLWLLDLGRLIEGRLGAGRLAWLVAIVAAISNLAQYGMGGPSFGGMSGVVYGLFGYVWLRGKLDPQCGLFIDPTNVTLMIVWFFACMSGFVGPIANTAHAAGLGVGLAWGFLAAKFSRGN